MTDVEDVRLALGRLPRRVRQTTTLFAEVTGLTAVTSFRSPVSDPPESASLTPPMHPLCASRPRATAAGGTCEEQWRRHLDESLRSRSVQVHLCPFGLRCGCIPIYYRDTLLGVAKCVARRGADSRRFSAAVRMLDLAISKACQDQCVAVQAGELEDLRNRLRHRAIAGGPEAGTGGPRPAGPVADAGDAGVARRSLVDRALDYIARHYLDADGSLTAIGRELGVTEKYLTSLFTAVVGQHMHVYILQLRVQHACQAILHTEKPVKQIAFESGFARADTFRRVFRRYVGVPPAAYRAAFARD